ncbi:MAG TPA: Fur family transcriptional regulator [Thermoleophilaceae bacterium]
MTEAHAKTSWADRATAELSAAGYKRGGAREAVLSLLDRQDCALSAFAIEDELRGGGRAVARASVYRILEQLESLGLVQRVETGKGSVLYEPVRGEQQHHHHLVCDRCGKLVPFADEELEKTIGQLSRRVPFEVSDHEVVLRGACDACSK